LDSQTEIVPLSSERRKAVAAFWLAMAVACVGMIVAFWLAAAFSSQPLRWIAGLIFIGGLAGVAQATVLWPLIEDSLSWFLASDFFARLREQSPTVAARVEQRSRQMSSWRITVMVQAVLQVLIAAGLAIYAWR
jgi:MFS family permease